MQHKIEEMEEREQELQAKIEALQADNDFTNERLTALQGQSASPKILFLYAFLLNCEISFSFGILFAVRLEHLQEKALKEHNSLGRSNIKVFCLILDFSH